MDFTEIATKYSLWMKDRPWHKTPHEDECKWATENDLEFLGKGATRAVFGLPNEKQVLKIEIVGRVAGSNSNLNEHKTWKEVPDLLRTRHLVPVLECTEDGRWLLMERVTPIIPSRTTDLFLRNAKGEWLVNLTEPEFCFQLRGILGTFGILDIHLGNMSSDCRLLDYGDS